MSFWKFLIPLLFSSSLYAAGVDPWVLEKTAGGKSVEFLVVLKKQADLSASAAFTRKSDRGRYVFAALVQEAEHSQSALQSWLRNRNVKHRSFYIVNALLVKGDRSLVYELSKRGDVDRIEGNPLIRNELPQSETPTRSPLAVEPNITVMRAPEIWALGLTGQGIVIGGADTGYRWTHDSLRNQYRGWNGATVSHNYNWHDAIHSGGGSCGPDSPAPCDDHGHGTHTMGTVVGDDGESNQIGMAPGAKWIGCRNMDQGLGTPARYLECLEFFLAPYPVGGTPAQGDPAQAPDITTNSWTCPPSEGCSDLTLQTAIDAQKAAGIMTVVAAGNSGAACSTVDDPPALYGSSYTIGATNNSDSMAGFSSRGPADTTALIKPDLVAPGVSIRSASRNSDTGYTTMSGTSMATPAVAGGVALIWSAIQSHQNDPDATAALLNSSAAKLTSIVEACGGDYTNGPNNTWGNGRLDVMAAYQQVCASTPAQPANFSVSVDVNNHAALSWDPVAGATEYEVIRGSGGCPGVMADLLSTTAATDFTDASVTAGQTYSFYVRALAGSCRSQFSSCMDVTIPSSCLFCDDFENGTLALDWSYLQPSWSESGGHLIGTPVKRKALAIAAPAFPGCFNCSIHATLLTSGGPGNRVWLLGWYIGKKDSVELLMKEESDRWILKQRSGGRVVARAKYSAPILPDTPYNIDLSFDGSAFRVEIDGVERIVLSPQGPLFSGTVGFQCRDTIALFDEVHVQ